jgi:hypothetical protein
MNFLNAIREWLKKYRTQSQEAKQQQQVRDLENLSCENINVTEFNGRLYISYKGVPIVRVDDLKVKAPELLAQSRVDYLAWKEKFNA